MAGCTNCGRAAAQGCQCFVVSGNPNVVVAGDGSVDNPYTISVTGDCDCNGVESVIDNGDGTFTVTLDNGDFTVITLPVGPQGPPGEDGADGAAGEQGPPGTPGVDGTDGADGAPGAPGAPGTDGADGAPGVGVTGVVDNGDGTFSLTLTDDTTTAPVATIPGEQGEQGEQGPPGTPGTDGADGEDGRTWWRSDGPPAPPTGPQQVGDFYLDGSTGDVYVLNADRDWELFTNIMGPDGPEGPQGDTGAAGTPGTDGTDGADGADGAPGVGIVSATDNGDGTFTFELTDGTTAGPIATIPGEQGEQGVPGADGVDGDEGPQGDPGPEGPPGPSTPSADTTNPLVVGSDGLLYLPFFPTAVTVTSEGNGVNSTATVVFPAGMFTAYPSVTVTPNTSAPVNVHAAVTAPTNTAVTVVVRRDDAVPETGVHVHAAGVVGRLLEVQGGTGPQLRASDVVPLEEDWNMIEVTVTCPTEGCGNQGIPITVTIPEGGQVFCGMCGAQLEPVQES